MDVLKSSEFRKTYASLKARTLVTVNGHVIGEWLPRQDEVAAWATREDAYRLVRTVDPSFPEFRPAPKPSKR